MPLHKSAQLLNANDKIEDIADEGDVILYDEQMSPGDEDVVEFEAPMPTNEMENVVVFKLPTLPGCPDNVELEVSSDDLGKEEEPKAEDKKKEVVVDDPWNWRGKGLEKFMEWVGERFSSVPRHSGKETSGIERVIAYLKKMNSEMSKAVSEDLDGKIDVEKLEGARKEIYAAVERLEEALDKLNDMHFKKKKAVRDGDGEIVKKAKQTAVGGIIVTVPLKISSIARTMINSYHSAGKDMERMWDEVVKKFKLDDGEQIELFQLLNDMGYVVHKPRLMLGDEKFDPTSTDNFDFSANYPA